MKIGKAEAYISALMCGKWGKDSICTWLEHFNLTEASTRGTFLWMVQSTLVTDITDVEMLCNDYVISS